MPEVSRFYGIRITMFSERGNRHHVPHFHAQYQDQTASFAIDPIHMMEGDLSIRQRRLVEAWAELHQWELLENWSRLDDGRLPQAIRRLE
jgi:hypothetical protein